MIYSDKQCGISSGELAKLRDALAVTQEQDAEDEWVREIEIDGLKSQIAELEAEITHYERLKAGEIKLVKTDSLDALPNILIQARIAFGMSQTELAHQLGLKPQQIQRYEATDYKGASLARLTEISKILNVHTACLFETDTEQQLA